jgi:hypothetical protein
MATVDTLRRGIMPHASPEQVDALLWNCTPYPFIGDARKLRRSMRRCLRRGGGTVEGAIAYAHDELDRAMAEYAERASNA